MAPTSSPEQEAIPSTMPQTSHGQFILTHDSTMNDQIEFKDWVQHCNDPRLWKTHWDEFETTWLHENAYNERYGYTTVSYKRVVLVSESDDFEDIRSNAPDRTGWHREAFYSRFCYRVWEANRTVEQGYFYHHPDNAKQKERDFRDILDKCRLAVVDWKNKNPPSKEQLAEKKRKRDGLARIQGISPSKRSKYARRRKNFEEIIQGNEGQLTLIWEQGLGIDSQMRNVHHIRNLNWHHISDEAAKLFGFTQDIISRTDVSICETPMDITARTHKPFEQLGAEDIAYNDMTCTKWNDLKRRACMTFLPIKVVFTTFPTMQEAKLEKAEREERKRALEQASLARVRAKRAKMLETADVDGHSKTFMTNSKQELTDDEKSNTLPGFCEDGANDAGESGTSADEMLHVCEQKSSVMSKRARTIQYTRVEGQPGYPQKAARGMGLYDAQADDLLHELKHIHNDPPLSWQQIADFFPGRSCAALRLRWLKIGSMPKISREPSQENGDTSESQTSQATNGSGNNDEPANTRGDSQGPVGEKHITQTGEGSNDHGNYGETG